MAPDGAAVVAAVVAVVVVAAVAAAAVVVIVVAKTRSCMHTRPVQPAQSRTRPQQWSRTQLHQPAVWVTSPSRKSHRPTHTPHTLTQAVTCAAKVCVS